MRISIVVLAAAALAAAPACSTNRNEAVCCVSEADCAALGVSEPRPCGAGQACKSFECVAAECATSADCISPDAPVCIYGLCAARCESDADCTGAAGGPLCASDGACVGCMSNDQCSAEAPFCDEDERRCRGCIADAECASGVCLEADGRCAADAEIIYVAEGGADTGDCTRASPCATLAFALQKASPSHNVIRIASSFLPIESTLSINRSVVFDGSDSTIRQPPFMPLFSVGQLAGVVTIEGMIVEGHGVDDPTISVVSGSTLRIVDSVIRGSLVQVDGGALDVRHAEVGAGQGGAVRCSNGTVSVRGARFVDATIGGANCQLNVSRSRFEEIADGSVGASGGVVIIENNVILQSYELADSMFIQGVAPGSTVRFNTFVNTSGIASDGIALACDGTPEVTNNIFAYGSAHPLGYPGPSHCPATFSLFDTVALPEHASGEGNSSADASTFFVDVDARDFHLAGNSPAKQAGRENPTTEDFDGKARPMPAGTRPDVGAYEAR